MSEKSRVFSMRRELDRLGAWHMKTHGSGFGRSGIPDIIACYKGRFLAIEAKVDGGVVSRIQARELRQIEKAGGVAMVAHDLNELRSIIGSVKWLPKHT